MGFGGRNCLGSDLSSAPCSVWGQVTSLLCTSCPSSGEKAGPQGVTVRTT